MAVGALTAETLESSQRNTLSAKSFYFDAITVGVRIEITLWQARSFGAKRQQAETLTSPRLLLDGAFPIPPVTQISCSLPLKTLILLTFLGPVKIYAQIYLQAPAE